MNPSIIYVAGAGHSGSSLLDALLASHPEIVGLGELHRFSIDPSERLCSCGLNLHECEFWGKIRENVGDLETSLNRKAAKLRKFPVPAEVVHLIGSAPTRAVSSLFADSMTAGMTRASIASVEVCKSAMKLSGSIVSVDSSKNALRLASMRSVLGEGLLTVHLVRDGRAVAASAMRREGLSMRTAAKQWVRANHNTHLVLRNRPGRSELRYEDLCSDPAGNLRPLVAALGLRSEGWSPVLRPAHQIPGNPMLRDGDAPVEADARWRSELGNGELEVFESIAGKLNRSYGYVDA